MTIKREYLTDLPDDLDGYGINKVLLVRKESIHLKHIFKEVFVRGSVALEAMTQMVGMDLKSYMIYMTNRMRRIYTIPRDLKASANDIAKSDLSNFFPSINLLDGVPHLVVFDYDGVITDKAFREFYERTIECSKRISRLKVFICTANPNINSESLQRKDLPLPDKIISVRGQKKKMRQIVELQKKYHYMSYVDNEIKYLQLAWVFGVHTYIWRGRKIKSYTLNDCSSKIASNKTDEISEYWINATKTEDLSVLSDSESGTIQDKRGRRWEIFSDVSYFDMICVRPVEDREFNSPLSFHFNSMVEAQQFMRLLAEAH